MTPSCRCGCLVSDCRFDDAWLALVAFVLFPSQGLGFALLVAAILAPTGAALGMALFSNPNVPVRVRRALNVESGLNDGIATPFVTLFIALAVAEESATVSSGWLVNAVSEIVVAVLVGIAIGVVGGNCFRTPSGASGPMECPCSLPSWRWRSARILSLSRWVGTAL